MDSIVHSKDSPQNPSQFLMDNIAMLPQGRALDIAMGNGRNSIFLAKMGFQVEGIDYSGEVVAEALKRASEEGISIQTRVEDLENVPYFEEETYDLVVCFNYLQRSLLPQMKNWVRLGGMLMYETFIVDQVQFGKPRNPDHLFKHNELLHAFSDFRVLLYHEGIIDDNKAIAGILAQKVLISPDSIKDAVRATLKPF